MIFHLRQKCQLARAIGRGKCCGYDGYQEELWAEPNVGAVQHQWLVAPCPPPPRAAIGDRLLPPSFPSMAGGEQGAGHWSCAMLSSILSLFHCLNMGEVEAPPQNILGPPKQLGPQELVPQISALYLSIKVVFCFSPKALCSKCGGYPIVTFFIHIIPENTQ